MTSICERLTAELNAPLKQWQRDTIARWRSLGSVLDGHSDEVIWRVWQDCQFGSADEDEAAMFAYFAAL